MWFILSLLYFDDDVAALVWLMWKSPLSATRYRTHVCWYHAISTGLLSLILLFLFFSNFVVHFGLFKYCHE